MVVFFSVTTKRGGLQLYTSLHTILPYRVYRFDVPTSSTSGLLNTFRNLSHSYLYVKILVAFFSETTSHRGLKLYIDLHTIVPYCVYRIHAPTSFIFCLPITWAHGTLAIPGLLLFIYVACNMLLERHIQIQIFY